ncbi:hypothetical protein BA718_11110 [Streptococcus gallolyticus subsp. gallolyticus]|uniref:hypothetical protein n=1 Tax=Streptococcus gallolyticus TaxID=315405 RepID=UPI0007E3DFE5|nr:hypothetical protein [Streptococcus gallolyticus]OAV81994.1 hypothetical protein A3651_11080 [Streptococcus gallolyticus subsp. gallolyticus]OCW49515.1 hypothetical protein BA718_11110 [Streptococcus gallolyticus subsp. gallolyticus]
MKTKPILDISKTIGTTFKFKEATPKREFGSDKIEGTYVFILDKNGNEQKVLIFKTLAELPILSKLKAFDEIAFENLEGYVGGISSINSTYVELKLRLKADNVKEVRNING